MTSLIYFYQDYEQGNSFLHSHTFSGHALGISAALATIESIEKYDILKEVNDLHFILKGYFNDIAQITIK